MNVYFTEAYIEQLSIHRIGNKIENEGVVISNEPVKTNEEILSLITHYFLNTFKINEFYNLFNEANINLNQIYSFSKNIFDSDQAFHNQSINIAKHLYNSSNHPKIKPGELYVVKFRDVVIDGLATDAIGLFKSENKDTFLKIFPNGGNFEIESDKGININKLDKGCIIFNLEQEYGYIISIIDNTNKNNEAHYWTDDFLQIKLREDDYYNTQNIISLAKSFITTDLPNNYQVSKAEQADLLNKSAKFLKEKETFNMDEFANEVIGQTEVIESFNKYQQAWAEERDVQIVQDFEISDKAVQKQQRTLKSVIKLDKNFHIYVHGDNQYITKGYCAESGLNYYQLFFKEEK